MTTKWRPRIWITRTAPSAERSVPLWTSAGFEPVAAPLLTLEPTGSFQPIPDDAELIFTSANALRFAPLLHTDRKVYCIGPATAKAASERGFQDVVVGDRDWTKLVELVVKTDRPLVHISGRHVRGAIVETLKSSGHQVYRRVVYASEPVKTWPVESGAFDYAALYSPLASQTLLSLPRRDTSSNIIALSEAVAAPFRERIDASRVHVARAPTEGAMIEAAQFAVARAKG